MKLRTCYIAIRYGYHHVFKPGLDSSPHSSETDVHVSQCPMDRCFLTFLSLFEASIISRAIQQHWCDRFHGARNWPNDRISLT